MRPHELLPVKPPSEFDPSIDEPDYFYNNFIQPMIPDMLRMMNNGIHINQDEVENLRKVIDNVLDTVEKTLANNSVMQEFQAQQYPKKFKEYEKEVTASCRTIDHYLKDYDAKNATHRTYLINHYLEFIKKPEDIKDKWSVKDIKAYNSYLNNDFLKVVIDKKVTPNHAAAIVAMQNLAKDKMNIWNKVRTDKVKAVKFEDLVPPFNPGSSKQKKEFFEFITVDAIAFSKDTGEAKWGRDQIEEIFRSTTDENIKEILQMFIDHSYSAIIRNNFLEAFDSFTIDNVLYGGVKLFGTKTFRPTGNSPNFLQLPSTKSIYAKPLKKCLIAPPGYKIWTIDYSALEDRVVANLSGDENKLNLFLEGLDGHSLNACGYFPKRLEPLLGKNTDNVAYVKKFMAEVDAGNKEIKTIRQESKGPTFGLAYGAYPKKIADTIKCSIAEATEIFDNYHNVLYPGITKFRERVILPQARVNKYIHMGLGCRMYVDDVDGDSRTLFNSASQFWSILTLITLNELHYEMDINDRHEDVKATATIYDSLYGIVKDNPESIKWLNDTVCPIMEKDFLEDQVLSNSANLEIGNNWADLTELPHNCDEDYIQGVLDDIDSKGK